MATDITRQVSASAYLSPTLSHRIIEFCRNPFNAVVPSPGLDAALVLKHALNARSREKTFYWLLFIPSLIFFFCLFSIVFIPFAFIVYLVLFFAVLINDQNKRRFIREHFTRSSFREDFSYTGPGQEMVQDLQRKTTKNVVYYSGYSPFVGCGHEVTGWSFVIDIDKGKKDAAGNHSTPKDFLEDELYYNIGKELTNLKIPNLTVDNKVYFNGRKIRDNKELLPDIFGHPVTEVSSEFTKKAMNSGIDESRFYKMIQVAGWEGDLVLIAFLRFQKGEKTLFVENNYYVIPPIKEEHREIDRIKQESGIRYFILMLLKYIFMTFTQVFASITRVMGYIGEGLGEMFGSTPNDRLKKIVRSSPDYDYGSSTSIRQYVAQNYYLQHFQKLDKERYHKTIDKRILNGLCNFLDSKDIDTTEFRERENSVLNTGIIVNAGGTLSGGNIAAGIGAAILNKFTPGSNPNPATNK